MNKSDFDRDNNQGSLKVKKRKNFFLLFNEFLLRAAVFSKTLKPPLDGTDVFYGRRGYQREKENF